jgi:hypothetical protein
VEDSGRVMLFEGVNGWEKQKEREREREREREKKAERDILYYRKDEYKSLSSFSNDGLGLAEIKARFEKEKTKKRGVE